MTNYFKITCKLNQKRNREISQLMGGITETPLRHCQYYYGNGVRCLAEKKKHVLMDVGK